MSPDGKQLGILETPKALEMAAQYNLDLVEIAPNASPPVCRIMDYGKYRYQLSKKEKESKKKQHVIHIKEIRLRPTTDIHDIEVKMKQAKKFLEAGHHVRIRIVFRGRQIAHPEFGQTLIQRVQTSLEDIAKMDKEPIQDGRNLIANFIPKS